MKRTAIFLITLTFLLSACASKPKYYFEEGEVFHTTYHIKYESSRSLENEIQTEFDKFNASLNPFQEKSVIYDVNNNIDVEVDSFFVQVFTKAEEISAFTDGMFDITCAPYINLWGFGFENLGKVDTATIDSIRPFVGYEKVHLVNNHVQKDDPRIKLNMSAIAKGYAVDVISLLLERHGVENYMCEIGGEVRTHGHNPDGKSWLIGINKPIDDNTGTISALQTKVRMSNLSMATSGNYRNYYYAANGKKYAHTINPKTGFPAEQDVLSASVIAPDCMTADALATSFMTVGLQRSKELLEKLPNVMVYLIYVNQNGENAVYMSPRLSELIDEK